MAPNSLASIIFGIAGPMYFATTNSSATFEIVCVNDIGRRCLLTLVTGFCLSIGVTFAYFQAVGIFLF